MSPLFDAYDYASDALDFSKKQALAAGDTKTSEKVQGYIDITEQIIEPFASRHILDSFDFV